MTLEELVQSISARPVMWVGSARLRDVALFLDGFCQGIESATGVRPLLGWHTWIETRYLISHPAWHWTAILRHAHGSDSAALAALPSLVAAFESETRGCSTQLLDQRHRDAFLSAFGAEHHAPSEQPPSD